MVWLCPLPRSNSQRDLKLIIILIWFLDMSKVASNLVMMQTDVTFPPDQILQIQHFYYLPSLLSSLAYSSHFGISTTASTIHFLIISSP